MRSFLAILCFLALTKSTLGLQCYSCIRYFEEGEGDSNDPCIYDPANVIGKNVITCPSRMTHCTIVRHEYISTGKVSSIERTCAENPIYIDDDITGPILVTHYRACQTDLCNNGTGVDNDNNSGEDDGRVSKCLEVSTALASAISSVTQQNITEEGLNINYNINCTKELREITARITLF